MSEFIYTKRRTAKYNGPVDSSDYNLIYIINLML